MILNQKKTKAMIFNFTEKFQFTTRLQIKNENIDIVDRMKILGTIVTKSLSWDENCQHLIKKVNARMQLLRNILSFGASNNEMVHIWTVFCRSVLEQSSVVWHSSLKQENNDDLERTQKSFCKIVLSTIHMNLNMESLKDRRESLSLKFAKSGLKFNKLNDLLPLNTKKHRMETRNNEQYKVEFANTKRLKTSCIPAIQRKLNDDIAENRKRNCG